MEILGREINDSFLEHAEPESPDDGHLYKIYGLPYDELCARILEMSNGAGNVEMPIGTAQWPTGQLTTHESSSLADAIRKRRTS